MGRWAQAWHWTGGLPFLESGVSGKATKVTFLNRYPLLMTVEGDIELVTGESVDADTARTINDLGAKSAKAQGLASSITFTDKLQSSGDRIYLFRQRSDQAALGFVRIGQRKLFLFDADTKLHELQPVCCLDFYVCEAMQRHGVGRQLFNEMMLRESLSSPSKLAFDKPSPNLLAFLSRHFALDKPIVQTNNFMIFLDFFQVSPGDPKAAKLLQQCQPHPRVKTHHHSSEIASLLSNSPSGEQQSFAGKSRRRRFGHLPTQQTVSESPTLPGVVSGVLNNTHLFRQEDIEAIRLSEESLSQINKKIEEREATIAAIEKELRSMELASDEYHFDRPGTNGFSKSELIRKIHAKK